MFFHPNNMRSENNNPWLKPLFNILLHTQSIVCATVDSHCLEYLGYITLKMIWICPLHFWDRYCKSLRIGIFGLPTHLFLSTQFVNAPLRLYFQMMTSSDYCLQLLFWNSKSLSTCISGCYCSLHEICCPRDDLILNSHSLWILWIVSVIGAK